MEPTPTTFSPSPASLLRPTTPWGPRISAVAPTSGTRMDTGEYFMPRRRVAMAPMSSPVSIRVPEVGATALIPGSPRRCRTEERSGGGREGRGVGS